VLEPNFSSVGPVGLYRGIEVYGNEGAALVTVAPERKLWVSADRDTVGEFDWSVTSPWAQNVVAHFHEVCLGEAENPCGIEAGYAAMEVIDRAQRSLEDGCTH
jgi:predicted dehydrogenase